jgi:CelD/BcsL family acetyltransferase involved in cellulose biosynthesis
MPAGSTTVTVDLAPAHQCPGLGEAWRSLEQRADGSFFLSWRWIGSWLAALPPGIEPLCLRARAGGEIVGLALLTPRRSRRAGLVAARQLHLNATGDPDLDRPTIEYNGFLLDRRVAAEAEQALLQFLAAQATLWNELVLDGVTPALADRLGALDGAILLRQRSICRFVDLAALGDGDGLAALGPNTRHQLRRMYRLCAGPRLEVASDATEAQGFLADLAALHQARWTARGHPGAFGSDFLMRFHRRLVGEGVPAGDVQLVRARAGDGRIVGHLYNFVHRDRVYAYQSGFPSQQDNRLKPGLLCHHLAMLMNRDRGLRVYDFLAGDSRYKRSLANRHGELVWIAVQRRSVGFAVERGLRALKARLQGRPDPDPGSG